MNLSLFDLSGKVAIVTGSGQGIGKAIAKGLASAGASVVVAARTVADIDATVSEIKEERGTAIAVPTDVTDSDQISNLVQKTAHEFGTVDVLVNNAGGVLKVEQALNMSKELWDDHIALNLTSTFLMSREVGRIMAQNRRGSIINISSIAAEKPVPGRVAYNAAKAGVTNLTEELALEWARYGIRVNAIHPGHVATAKVEELYKKLPPEDRQQRLSFIPLNRFATPEDFVGPSIFLASDASAYITGAVLKVDGGMIAVVGKRRDDLSSLW